MSLQPVVRPNCSNHPPHHILCTPVGGAGSWFHGLGVFAATSTHVLYYPRAVDSVRPSPKVPTPNAFFEWPAATEEDVTSLGCGHNNEILDANVNVSQGAEFGYRLLKIQLDASGCQWMPLDGNFRPTTELSVEVSNRSYSCCALLEETGSSRPSDSGRGTARSDNDNAMIWVCIHLASPVDVVVDEDTD
ncbi:GM24636 [Drosophila sechellia]|uniref:GM24636 n=1 Tax=Drosophila sechellia TaxID=7238 RepID=B4HG51_DROSE|nr:GM24636 [Drosophila sechellia]